MTNELKNDLLLRAARGEQTERAPVWVMRQAGRYLPEFMEVRKSYDFFTMCRTPKVAAEVTMQPLRRFPLDAVIIFSDILVIPQALGMTVEMIPGKGPHFPEPLITPECMKKLTAKPDVKATLGYVSEAIKETKRQLDGQVPLIGFCGGPWTLMAYMVEGGGSKTFSKAKAWLYKYPVESLELLYMIADLSIDYLVEQVRAGANILQVFESWAGELTPVHFAKYSLPLLSHIASSVKTKLAAEGLTVVPMTVFAKGAHYALEDLAESPYDVIGLDWTMDPKEAIRRTGGKKTLQGNMDPCALYGSTETIAEVASDMVARFGGGKGRYIANMGHGMNPDHQPDHLGAFIAAVQGSSSK
ncbi:uroporphyrinogen decarboxylase [Sphaeroforma arctica JP610]|uniref:Uroporphyrinogen decarboxylase n=1 Tax=Sphaeroforma arctica JP610 TaxID=667725 RepID=A0A0L0GE46_9EUKA|nr:uroporphyrinogen decarboxylase [Sphaeroforma arctica JP610]KNC87164.1 uroporphyrinogen decarboxylase [Sphaeroforma arctica JP610]|eukprot:XP_014161066.1 uroporphyrinogen decarboxylase [Sphaeroforma arctica JP610]